MRHLYEYVTNESTLGFKPHASVVFQLNLINLFLFIRTNKILKARLRALQLCLLQTERHTSYMRPTNENT